MTSVLKTVFDSFVFSSFSAAFNVTGFGMDGVDGAADGNVGPANMDSDSEQKDRNKLTR